MDSLVEMFLLNRMSTDGGILDTAKITGDGHLKLLPRRAYAEGSCLVKQAGKSMSKFTAAFKTHTGLSAAGYIHRLRMDKAMDIVKNTSCPLAEAAGAAGYKHYTSFSTAFRNNLVLRRGSFAKRKLKITDV
jgi:methylphosphotriester-DNA--protein-cysteine methyltransferase